ncbi:division cycle 7-related kinase-like [Argonauta hians]
MTESNHQRMYAVTNNRTQLNGDEITGYMVSEIDKLYESVPELKKHFHIIKKIGEGTFSSVFQAKLRNETQGNQLFALKHIIPTSHPTRIETELKCLQELGGNNNVMGVELCLRNNDHIVIGMPYFPHDKIQDCLSYLRPAEIQCYMKNLLIALSHVHEQNIIHRDVKPSNFLFNRKTQQFSLVDFGLAHKAPLPPKKTKVKPDVHSQPKFLIKRSSKNTSKLDLKNIPPADRRKNSCLYTSNCRREQLQQKKMSRKSAHDKSLGISGATHTCQCFGKPMICYLCSSRPNQIAPRAGTPGFRSPEVLMKYPLQTTSVDIWSAGVIFLSLLSARYPFFKANDDLTALAQIITLMGSEEIKRAAKKIGKDLICLPYRPAVNLKDLCSKLRSSNPFDSENSFGNGKNGGCSKGFINTVGNDAFDLLQKMLDLDPETRIHAKDAINHPYFAVNYDTAVIINTQKTNKKKIKKHIHF